MNLRRATLKGVRARALDGGGAPPISTGVPRSSRNSYRYSRSTGTLEYRTSVQLSHGVTVCARVTVTVH